MKRVGATLVGLALAASRAKLHPNNFVGRHIVVGTILVRPQEHKNKGIVDLGDSSVVGTDFRGS